MAGNSTYAAVITETFHQAYEALMRDALFDTGHVLPSHNMCTIGCGERGRLVCAS